MNSFMNMFILVQYCVSISAVIKLVKRLCTFIHSLHYESHDHILIVLIVKHYECDVIIYIVRMCGTYPNDLSQTFYM